MGNTVNLYGYCKAFEALDVSENELCAPLNSANYYAEHIQRGKRGDGVVKVKSNEGTQYLHQDGRIVKGKGRWATEVKRVDPQTAKYFIAGAFGVGELKGEHNLDKNVLKNLKKLYVKCAYNPKTCQSSKKFQEVSQMWQDKKDFAQKLSGLKSKYESKKEEYNQLKSMSESTSDLLAKVSTLENQLPRNISTTFDYEKSVEIYGQLIEITTRHNKEVEKQRTKESKMQRIEFYKSEVERISKSIVKEVKKRKKYVWDPDEIIFKKALDAGKNNFPSGLTLDEQYCGWKNKYEMVKGLKEKLDDFPKHSVCDKYETRTSTDKVNSFCSDWKTVQKNGKSIRVTNYCPTKKLIILIVYLIMLKVMTTHMKNSANL